MPGARRPPAPKRSRKRKEDVARKFEEAISELHKGKYVLRLFVAGTTARSARAIANLKGVCDEYLEGRYDLEVIDVYQQGARTKEERIIAAPTLIKKLPPPVRKLVGDMSDKEKILVGLDIRERKRETDGRGTQNPGG
jgi:circadian clock protein KaiB